ncbi:MAG: ATP-binding protein, partial [Planctomycetota bacterium]
MTELLFSLSMPPDAHYLGALRAFFKPILERHCESDSEKLLLALGEAVSNVIQHRCSSLADEQIRVAASLADDLVRFELGGFCRTDDLPRIHGR